MENKLGFRVFQHALKAASHFVDWRTPKLFYGKDGYRQLAEVFVGKRVLIVTDKVLKEIGLVDDLILALDSVGVEHITYSGVKENPTVDNVEAALQLYNDYCCGAVIGFGGGSPIDCAKIVSARAADSKRSVAQMKGLMKLRKKLVPLAAIPTTAGTGSETTIAAVIKDEKTHEKYAISDMKLIPLYAVMDHTLTKKLSPFTTATTGMDALTHAVEAYIGCSNTTQTKKDAIAAVRLINDNLYEAFLHGDSDTARMNMQEASFLAGRAFTRAYVGNVHAIAHTLGGLYDVPHGYANAITLPVVLKAYGKRVYKSLAELSDCLNLCSSDLSQQQKAESFIEWIENLNASMNICGGIYRISRKDIPLMAERAYHEANPLYPVPQIWSKKDFERIIGALMEVI